MASITTRAGKGSPLTNAEVDANFTNLNTELGQKLVSADLAPYLTSTSAASTYQPLDADLTSIAALAGTSGFLKKTAANTWSLDTNTYLTGNQSISISGDATGSGTTSIALTLANSGVTAGTYTKVTVDAKGRVTTGASLASADLPTYTGTLTSSQVTTALGYTPYNSTNPSGYITGITSGMVTTALGYTPYNSTNPSGYITSSALSSYLPLGGGTLTGVTNISTSSQTINTTTPGTGAYQLNFTGQATADNAHAITWGWSTSGAQAGIYVQSSGAYGTRMYLATTDSFATGAKTAVSIDELGNTNIVRGALRQGGNQVLHAGNYTSYAPSLTGSGASGTWGINVTGSAGSVAWTNVSGRPTALSSFTNDSGYITSSSSISGSAGSVSGLTLTSSANGINPDSVTQNQIGYNTSVSLFGQTDGGLYSSAYSSSWIHQIYGDFRTGQIAIRGKNSGTWQAWRTVLDSSNYTSYSPSLTGSGASGTWGINVTGSAGSVAWTSVSGRPTALSSFTNDSGYITASSPALSGTPTAPTAAVGTNTTQIATTAYVNAEIANDAPTKTGGGASGTWGISITGNAATVTNGVYTTGDQTIAGVKNFTGGTAINSFNVTGSTLLGASVSGNALFTGGWASPVSGRLYIGDGTGWTYYFSRRASSTTTDLFTFTDGGNFTATGNVTANSDERLKTNWRSLSEDFVQQLAGVKSGVFDRIDMEGLTQAGVSAQSLQAVLPHVVSKGLDGILSVNYGNAALVAAVELAKRVVRLEAQLAKLIET